MSRLVIASALAALATSSVATTAPVTMYGPNGIQTPCPTFTPGQPYPWESGNAGPGDQWTSVFLLIDKHGHATDCRIGEGNIRNKDTRGKICMSFVKNWYTKPILKDGKPVEGWFKRLFIIAGTKHKMSDLEARKSFFEQHPDERPECYPQYIR